MQEHLSIKGLGGKRTLVGEVRVAGAKNAALKGIATSILFETPLRFSNVPRIEDVARLSEVINSMGGVVERNEEIVTADTRKLNTSAITPEIAKRLRASIVLTGPLLARFGSVKFPHPGGCVIGERPIDIFLEAFELMGATVKHVGKFYEVKTRRKQLMGAEIFLRAQSVTVTETLMMAATLAKGKTVINNAALEPEITWLAELLNKGGAHIVGAGTATVTITGGTMLHTKEIHPVMPDRIEAGSFLILAALAAKDMTISDCEPKHLEALIEALHYSGVVIEEKGKTLRVRAPKKGVTFRAVNIKTHEYPGFPTDLQAPMTVFLTQTKGESLVFETIFEGRLNYTESLVRMGANITMMDPHRILVKDPAILKGRTLESPDLRAGLAFVIAAIIGRGQSQIYNVYNIDRGYENIVTRLKGLGVSIERKDA